MRLEFMHPWSEGTWGAELHAFPSRTFFHGAAWARTLWETYRYPLLYGVLRDGGEIAAMAPLMEVASRLTGRRGVGLPFSDLCAPLARTREAADELAAAHCALGSERRWDYAEWRGGAAAAPGAAPSDAFMVHELELEPSEEAQFKKLKESHRRNVAKARKEGVEIERLETMAAMETYYGLHCLTRRRHGLPPQSLEFFRNLLRHAVAAGQGCVMLARWQGRVVAGAVYLHEGEQAVYKFGASDFAFQHLRANNLLMWEAILHFRARGLKRFHFGRSDAHQAGLLQFKRGWGAQETPLQYYRRPLGKAARARPSLDREEGSGWSARVMRRLPIPVLRGIGTLLYRHMG